MAGTSSSEAGNLKFGIEASFGLIKGNLKKKFRKSFNFPGKFTLRFRNVRQMGYQNS